MLWIISSHGWAICPYTCNRMSFYSLAHVLKLNDICPHGMQYISLDFKVYIPKLLDKCSYAKKRVSLDLSSHVLTRVDLCPHVNCHMSSWFKPYVFVFQSIYHMSLCYKEVVLTVSTYVLMTGILISMKVHFLLRFFFLPVCFCLRFLVFRPFGVTDTSESLVKLTHSSFSLYQSISGCWRSA